MRSHALLATVFHLTLAVAQLNPQTDTWNSTYKLTTAQINAANISSLTASLVDLAADFEQTNWATGSVLQDPFYTDIPSPASGFPPGSLLKTQQFVNTSTYTLAPTLALSRILFVTESLNGTYVPASAYILWPRLPLAHGPQGNIPLVGWGHGTSGFLPECAPSHIRNLWYQFSGPYTLALSGYAVVAPDYAGLGVNRNANGKVVVSQPFAFPSAANDIINAVKAAQAAFSNLSKDFVVVGHSLGGGAAWGVAQKMASSPVPGYLGTVAGSPVTNLTLQIQVQGPESEIGFIEAARGFVSAYSNRIQLSDILTPQGIRLLNLLEEVQGCNSVIDNLLAGLAAEGDPAKLLITNDTFFSSDLYTEWIDTTSNGGKAIGGPLLVLQGTSDTTVPEVVTTTAVNQTCEIYSDSSLEYLRFQDVEHVPVMYASQRIWLQWIADRFAHKPVNKGCQQQTYGQSSAPRPLQDYQGNLNYFLEYANQVYQTA
ncbi:hypothetical protein DV736_g5638, partial [Chaetothyriales sp. CBS 134916]